MNRENMRITDKTWGKWDRRGFWIAFAGAIAYAVAALAVAVASVTSYVSTREFTVTVPSAVPVPQGTLAGVAVTTAQYSSVDVTTAHLSTGVTAGLLAASLATALMHFVVAVAVALIIWRLLRGDPFRRSVVVGSVVVSLTLIVGGALSLLVGLYATTAAMQEIVGSAAGGDLFPYQGSIDFTPIFVGGAFAAVTAILQVGGRIKADTEGLI